MHGFIGGLRGFDYFFADTVHGLFGVFQCGGKTLAGFSSFFSGDLGCRGHQGARIFHERTHVISGYVCVCS